MQNYNGFNYGNFNNPYAPQYQHMQNNPQNYKLIPVSSKNEVNSFITDFNGTPVYFHDQGTNTIYIKQFDMKTGLAKIQEFKHAESDLSHVEHEGNTNPFEENFKALNDRLDGLYEILNAEVKEDKNDK